VALAASFFGRLFQLFGFQAALKLKSGRAGGVAESGLQPAFFG
jgi:hypothetical protein